LASSSVPITGGVYLSIVAFLTLLASFCPCGAHLPHSEGLLLTKFLRAGKKGERKKELTMGGLNKCMGVWIYGY